MAWSKAQLNEVAAQRLAKRQGLRDMEQAALAYARWQGLTDEVGVDRDTQKQLLDQALDKLEQQDVSAWNGLALLADDLGEPALKGLMRYSLNRAADQLKADIRSSQAPEGLTLKKPRLKL